MSGLVALVSPGKNRIKNSPKRVLDLEEEVGGKGQGTAGVVTRAQDGEGASIPMLKWSLRPHPVLGAGEERQAGNEAAPLRRFHTGPKVLSQPGRPKPPSYRVSWHP